MFDNTSVFYVPVKSPRGGDTVEHLYGILALVGENLNNNFQKSQMPGGLSGGDVEASI